MTSYGNDVRIVTSACRVGISQLRNQNVAIDVGLETVLDEVKECVILVIL